MDQSVNQALHFDRVHGNWIAASFDLKDCGIQSAIAVDEMEINGRRKEGHPPQTADVTLPDLPIKELNDDGREESRLFNVWGSKHGEVAGFYQPMNKDRLSQNSNHESLIEQVPSLSVTRFLYLTIILKTHLMFCHRISIFLRGAPLIVRISGKGISLHQYCHLIQLARFTLVLQMNFLSGRNP